jgi:hypothetical protein
LIRANIEQKLKSAQKSHDEVVVSTLRLILAAVKNYQIDQRARELTDDELVMLLKREAKKRSEAIEAYAKAGREESRAKEAQELAIIKEYLPPELSTDEINQVIRSVVSDTGANDPSQFGRVMGEAMKRLGSAVSGQTVSALVKSALTKPKE